MQENKKWLHWAQRLQALAQTGLTFAEDEYNIERYTDIQEIAAEIIASYSEGLGEVEEIRQLFATEKGYATPKVDVRAAVFKQDAILLVRERDDGLWSLPGGWADVQDSPKEAVEREVYEESGYTVVARKLIALQDRNKHDHPPYLYHVYKAFFLCEIIAGEATPSYETTEVGFFKEEALPPLSLTRNVPEQVARLFKHHREPDLATEFD